MNISRCFRFLVSGFFFSLLLGVQLYAWQPNGVPICVSIQTIGISAEAPAVVSDGVGGAIIAWEDNRDHEYTDIYTERVDSTGNTLWTLNGVAICTDRYDYYPSIVSDGSGGAIINWIDTRYGLGHLYFQRVNSSGTPLWALGGVAIFTTYEAYLPTMVSDGSGGAIITWYDDRNGFGIGNIFAQHVNSSGNAVWAANGISIATVGNDQSPTITSDGLGGAIITWEDGRTGTTGNIYAQHVDSSGNALWTTNGVVVCTAARNQYDPTIVSDGSGGAIIAWQDTRNEIYYNIYAQHVDSTGNSLWTTNGVEICNADIGQYNTIIPIVSDSADGAIMTWMDNREGEAIYNIYSQRVNSTGSTLWRLNGVAVCTATNYQYNPTISSDGYNGAIVTWEDFRNGSTLNIYAQHVNSEGSTLWINNGRNICNVTNSQYLPTIVSDGLDGAIIAWDDYRYGQEDSNIFAQRINGTGYVPYPSTELNVVNSSETVTFHVGDTTGDYLPVQLYFVSTSPDTVTVTMVDTTAPNLPTNHYIPRYWIITPVVTESNLTTTITFSYTSSDFLASGVPLESELVPSWDTTGLGNWVSITTGVTVDTVNHQLTVSGITHFSNWTLGAYNGLVPVEDWELYAGDRALIKSEVSGLQVEKIESGNSRF